MLLSSLKIILLIWLIHASTSASVLNKVMLLSRTTSDASLFMMDVEVCITNNTGTKPDFRELTSYGIFILSVANDSID